MDYAKKLISIYYGRVQKANEYFTNYKEGWKTEQGMIYCIFGQPDEVISEKLEQQWIYKGRKNELIFSFIPKLNALGIVEYKLEKNKEYEIEWFNAVEKWRRGVVD